MNVILCDSIKGEHDLKKIIALLLCLVTVAACFAGCTDKEDPGAELTLYMDSITSLDPALAYNDATASQLLSLVYEGLVNVNEKGKVEGAIAKSWKLNGNVLEFRLNETKWSDGTSIQAKDFVYAWKRILDPQFQCSAASLLMYIKNAAEVKNGDTSIDDLGLYASGTNLLSVELIDASYADAFLLNCASVALSPLREDTVGKIKMEPEELYAEHMAENNYNVELEEYSWATLSAVLLANGPFYVKTVDLKNSEDPGIVLERNKYYFYNSEKEEALQKYVVPYRLNIKTCDPAAANEAYNAGTGLYNSNLPLSERAGAKDSAEITDLMSTYSYLFNTTNPLFADARVTRALSLALDRNAIAEQVVFAKAATGLLTDKVFFDERGTSFREKATKLSTSADMDAAKALLQEAGVSGGSFTIAIHDTEVEEAVANAAVEAWGQLGFSVTVKKLGTNEYKYYEFMGVEKDDAGNAIGYKFDFVYEHLLVDDYINAYRNGEFDVIGVDVSMMSADPFAALAQFARKYSGGAYDFSESADVFELVAGVTGYASEEYDALIDQALAEKDAAKRAEILVQAEEKLLSDAPIAPVYFMQSGAKISDNLKKLSYDYDGNVIFTEAKDKNYKYVPEVEAMIPVKYWD